MAKSALTELTGMPNLPLTRSLQQPAKTPKGYLGSAEVGPVLSELGEAETKAQTKVGEADIAIEEAKRQEKGKEAEQKMLLTERLGQEAKDLPERKALGEARQELQEMAFVPSKETATDLATMFSLISVVGMVAGKGNAQLAMSAMNGMLEGHQKGRADLYKQQQTEFDKNFKAMQAKISTLEKGVTEAMELKKYDKEAGEQKMIMELARAESPLLKAMKDKQGDVAVLNNVRSIRKDMDTLVGLNNTLQKAADARQDAKDTAAAAERRHRENLAQRDRIAKEQMALREKLAKAAAAAKDEAAKKGGTLKPGAKITEGYVADTVLKNDIEDLKKDLANPKLVEMLKQYRVEAFLTEEGKILNQLISSDIPTDLQKFLTKVRDIRNNYYLTISGKAVTGGEALRNYGTVPQPGDDSREMINKLDGMAGRVNQSIQLKRQLFGLPELNLMPGMRTNLKPNEDYSVNSQTTYEINKVYTDDKGNKAKYLGNDEWQEIE
jgi:hypothetical protein